MSALALTGEQVFETLPPQLKALVLAHASDVASDPIKDKRYVELSRSGSSVAEFLTWFEADGADDDTLVKYELALARMCMFRPELAVEDWDAGTLLQFITEYPRKFDLSENSMRTNVYAPLRKFFGWAVPWKRLPWNPMDLMPKPKRGKPKVLETFTREEQAKLVLAAEQSPLGKRDKAALLLLLDTGARKTDVRLLKWEDVNLAEGYVVYRHRKGDKEQALPFGETLRIALMDAFHSPYPIRVKLADVERNGKTRRSYEKTVRTPTLNDYVLFPNGYNGDSARAGSPSWISPWRPMAESTMHRWWIGLLDAAEVNRRKLHMTRHTHGTELYEATGDIEAVRDRLGHASYETTRIYVHNSRRRGIATVQALETYRQALLASDPPKPGRKRSR